MRHFWILGLWVIVLRPTFLNAHPEHGGSEKLSLSHYLSDPFHLLWFALFFGVLAALLRAMRLKRQKR